MWCTFDNMQYKYTDWIKILWSGWLLQDLPFLTLFAISSRRQDSLFLPSMLLETSGNNDSSISHTLLLKNNDSRIKTSIS